MNRVLAFLFLAFAASASAFVPQQTRLARPFHQQARSAPRAESKMVLDAVPVESLTGVTEVVNNAMAIASADDFGGYAFPIGGLTLLTGIIFLLAPPLNDESTLE